MNTLYLNLITGAVCNSTEVELRDIYSTFETDEYLSFVHTYFNQEQGYWEIVLFRSGYSLDYIEITLPQRLEDEYATYQVFQTLRQEKPVLIYPIRLSTPVKKVYEQEVRLRGDPSPIKTTSTVHATVSKTPYKQYT